jgi:hypothetical protein
MTAPVKPRLVLHAGTHKTGTTAIQDFAHTYRESLAENGFYYPNLNLALPGRFPGRADGVFANAHHHFFHALAGDTRFLDESICSDLVRIWYQECASQGLSLLLSSESVSRHLLRGRGLSRSERSQLYLQKLNEQFSLYFDIEVVLVFRRPDDYARSLYQEQVMRGTLREAISLETFIENHADRFDYVSLVSRFEQVFPRLSVFGYEQLCAGGDLCAEFFSRIGAPSICLNLDRSGASIVRLSLTPPQTMLKLCLNQSLELSEPLPHRSVVPSSRANRRLLEWLRSERTVTLLNRIYPRSAYGFWGDGSLARQSFLSSLEPMLSEMASRYGIRFPAFDSGQELPMISPPSIAQLADLIVSMVNYGIVGVGRNDGASSLAPKRSLEFLRKFSFPLLLLKIWWKACLKLRLVIFRG